MVMNIRENAASVLLLCPCWADVSGGRRWGAFNFASEGENGDFWADDRRSHYRVGAFAARTKDWIE